MGKEPNESESSMYSKSEKRNIPSKTQQLSLPKKDQFLSPPLQAKIQKKEFKSNLFTKNLRKSLDMLIPNVLKNWIYQKKIASEIPLKTLNEAVRYLDEHNLTEVIFSSKENKNILLGIKNIRDSLPKLSPEKLEAVLTAISSSKNPQFQRSFLGKFYDILENPVEEILELSVKQLHIAIILLRKDMNKLSKLIKNMPNHTIHKLLPLLSTNQLWEVFLLMETQQVGLTTSMISPPIIKKMIEKKLPEDKLCNIIPLMNDEQIGDMIGLIIDKESTLSEEKLILLKKVLTNMKAEQISTAINLLTIHHKKSLLGHFWQRPIGITTAVANDKMQLYQIATAATHPTLVVDILNAVEWMNQQQTKATRHVLSSLAVQAKSLISQRKNLFSQENLPLNREETFLIDCCMEIKKLQNQKSHLLHKEISNISNLTDELDYL